jgi:hypothetical protein
MATYTSTPQSCHICCIARSFETPRADMAMLTLDSFLQPWVRILEASIPEEHAPKSSKWAISLFRTSRCFFRLSLISRRERSWNADRFKYIGEPARTEPSSIHDWLWFYAGRRCSPGRRVPLCRLFGFRTWLWYDGLLKNADRLELRKS